MTINNIPEGIHAENVTRWFQDNIDGCQPPFTFELIAGGHSNLTYKLTDSTGQEYVLRRPPLGHVLESAHDMGREHRIISAVGSTNVPVAPALGLCKDTEVNGAPFYVMGFVEGFVLHGIDDAKAVPEADRYEIGLDVIDVLGKLHNLNPDDIGLGELGRKEAYLARQLKRWTKQWENSKTREVPEMEETRRLLEEHMPEQVGATVVHGDYRLGNFLLSGTKVAGVLDWELCTLGDPLADVGYLMNAWPAPDETQPGRGDMLPTAAGGFPLRKELLERYQQATGRDISLIPYYQAFSHWRSAAIAEGVYNRYLHGAMGKREDVDLTAFEQSAPRSAGFALELLGTII